MSERARPAEDAEVTIVLPTPGRKRSAFAPAAERHAAAADLAALGGLNPLVEAANTVLAAVPQIRHALRHPDPASLRARLREQLETFERTALAAGIARDELRQAHLALCALLDDSAAATPWGRHWAPLMAELHGETSGSDGFFSALDHLLARPHGQSELLEFFYACLTLGFEGRYRGGEGGRQALAQARTRLFDLIDRSRGERAKELSPRWRGAEVPARRVTGPLAVWSAACACALFLAVLYFSYSVLLGARSDPVARELARLKLPPIELPAAPPAGGTVLVSDLARSIGPDVEVSDVPGGAMIVLKSDNVFASASARPDASVIPVIQRVATALSATAGAIVVSGHTDDQPIRTARFPSNWELSTERARSVLTIMAPLVADPGRLRAEGLADSEPLVPNDTTANRARNRRVAILLRSGT